ncbi:THUMP domain-containing protein [Caenorhabditis elegans]|uniref:THUMP domain-containing protein n=1 Tax=Caenorhabditis elegans TaxID=6239 RepID=Q21503_CAEEL|nr:THUMP domain-containing protein [Caenorhabditis elegans]CAB01236.2 THUMP domain-containing protein [Caenorhabditis elegans]|eukprot:NP_502174.2 Uncharacterized protein CELE_M04B2.2 [Caenorhabditis elegans]
MTDSVEICAAVITGFEKVAAKEISKLFSPKKCHPGRGNVRFSIDLERVNETLQLRSIDNLYMVFYEETIEKLSEMQKEDALKTIQSQISFCNWKLAIEAYQLARGNAINGGSEKILKQIQQFKKDRIYSEVTDDSPKFRVTCKRCGEKEIHKFSSMDAASKFGAEINNAFGWKCSVKEFDIEVVLRIDRNNMTVMMALNEESLFKRNICAYGPTTMRSTMCHCMLQLADIKPGDIIVDAMCGGGSIPIEGAISWKNSLFLGGDNHEMAMSRCLQNWSANSSSSRSNCDFLTWDATNLPLRDNSIDALVTDLPFGKKIGSTTDNRLLYPRLLAEWKRVLRKGGRLVLMTHDKRSLENSFLKDRSSWQTDASHVVNVGGLSCLCICMINRKSD